MKWNVPGTVLQIRREDADAIQELFDPMFWLEVWCSVRWPA